MEREGDLEIKQEEQEDQLDYHGFKEDPNSHWKARKILSLSNMRLLLLESMRVLPHFPFLGKNNRRKYCMTTKRRNTVKETSGENKRRRKVKNRKKKRVKEKEQHRTSCLIIEKDVIIMKNKEKGVSIPCRTRDNTSVYKEKKARGINLINGRKLHIRLQQDKSHCYWHIHQIQVEDLYLRLSPLLLLVLLEKQQVCQQQEEQQVLQHRQEVVLDTK